MNHSCPHEVGVASEVRSEESTELLRLHAVSCPVCREVLTAALWMQTLAQDSRTAATVPDAAAVWRHAHFLERLREEQAGVEQAHKIVERIQAASLALVFFGLLFWAPWDWRTIDSTAFWLSPHSWAAAYNLVLTPEAAWSILGILFFIVAALAYPIVAADY